jgi:DNA-binding response OmpR family regulator
MPQNPPPNLPSLRGRRILVVEDEMLVSMMLEDLLGEQGCEIVGPAARLGRAVTLASTDLIDAAILDLNIDGQEVYPVAKILADRGIPFAFVTGYSAGSLNKIYRDQPALQKPCSVTALAEVIRAMLNEVTS